MNHLDNAGGLSPFRQKIVLLALIFFLVSYFVEVSIRHFQLMT